MTDESHRAQYGDRPYPDLFMTLPAAERALLLVIFSLLDRIPTLRLAIGNLKGGVGKSTTSIYIALILALAGRRILFVDTDGTNRTATNWSLACEDWPPTVRVVSWGAQDNEEGTQLVGITPNDMGERIEKAMPKFQDLIVDIGPQRQAYLRRALRYCNNFICLSGQYSADTTQIGKALDLAAVVAGTNDVDVFTRLLFTRVNQRTKSFKEVRLRFRTAGVEIFKATIPTADHYGKASDGIFPTKFAEYLPVVKELLQLELDEWVDEEDVDAEAGDDGDADVELERTVA